MLALSGNHRITTISTNGRASWKPSVKDVKRIDVAEYAIHTSLQTPKAASHRKDGIASSPRQNLMSLHKQRSTSSKMNASSAATSSGTGLTLGCMGGGGREFKLRVGVGDDTENKSLDTISKDRLHNYAEEHKAANALGATTKRWDSPSLESAMAYLKARHQLKQLHSVRRFNYDQSHTDSPRMHSESTARRKWCSPLVGYHGPQNMPVVSMTARESVANRRLRKAGIQTVLTGSPIINHKVGQHRHTMT